jgi:hypothetical protein
LPAVGAGGAGRQFNAVIAATGSILSAGVVAAVLKSARPVWMKMCGACRAIISPGSVLIAASSTASAISEDHRAVMMTRDIQIDLTNQQGIGLLHWYRTQLRPIEHFPHGLS